MKKSSQMSVRSELKRGLQFKSGAGSHKKTTKQKRANERSLFAKNVSSKSIDYFLKNSSLSFL